jgi:hypothetical protein
MVNSQVCGLKINHNATARYATTAKAWNTKFWGAITVLFSCTAILEKW